MTTQRAAVRSLDAAGVALHACALDFPANGKEPRFSERGLYIQCWVLEANGVHRGDLLLRSSGNIRLIPFNNDRPDVVQRILGLAPEAHPQKRCGVIAWVNDVSDCFELGVMLDGAPHWLWQIQLNESQHQPPGESPTLTQVIVGDNNWLYLSNDTNRSVDQYTGSLILGAEGLNRWSDYLDQCVDISCEVNAHHSLIFAASKEQVLPQHYPYQKGTVTVYEQVLKLCKERHHVVDTVALLSSQPDRDSCFIKTDTHWTDRGARAAVISLLGSLGFNPDFARGVFADDVYYFAPFAGDLGIKFVPSVAESTEFLQAPPAPSGAVFDNQLANIGRILIFERFDAPVEGNLLLFGASSSYPMLKYLKRLFGRIVFVHSAGNVDPSVVIHEQPEFLVMQTTARFMIEPPCANFDLAGALKRKMSHRDDEGLMIKMSSQAQYANSKNQFYVNLGGNAE